MACFKRKIAKMHHAYEIAKISILPRENAAAGAHRVLVAW